MDSPLKLLLNAALTWTRRFEKRLVAELAKRTPRRQFAARSGGPIAADQPRDSPMVRELAATIASPNCGEYVPPALISAALAAAFTNSPAGR